MPKMKKVTAKKGKKVSKPMKAVTATVAPKVEMPIEDTGTGPMPLMPTVGGVQVLEIIGEHPGGTAFHCRMADGTTTFVSKELFK